MQLQRMYVLSRHHLRRMIGSWLPPLVVAVGVLLTVSLGWSGDALTLPGIVLEGFAVGSGELESKRLYFYDQFSWAWLVLVVGYLPRKVLFPLANSFAVSQSLWLRLTPSTAREVAASRGFLVLTSAAWLAGLGFAWALVFWMVHGVPLRELSLPVVGLAGHVLMAGGIVLVFSPGHTATMVSRSTLALTALVTPALLYVVGRVAGEAFAGFFPYASPFLSERIGSRAMRPFETACMVGLALVLLHPLAIEIQTRLPLRGKLAR